MEPHLQSTYYIFNASCDRNPREMPPLNLSILTRATDGMLSRTVGLLRAICASGLSYWSASLQEAGQLIRKYSVFHNLT